MSKDDLEVLADTRLNPKALRANPDAVRRIVTYLQDNLDRGRFPWQGEPQEEERRTAVIATAAMLAMRRVETTRRMESQKEQEAQVAELLHSLGFTRVPTRRVQDFKETPGSGQFFPECLIGREGPKKADFLVGLPDGRALTIECKVSNSYTNSIKRLNDATSRALIWEKTLGDEQMVPAAVINGVYSLKNLQSAQRRVSLFWSHDLQKLEDWIRSIERR